jgi:hypothetical protein
MLSTKACQHSQLAGSAPFSRTFEGNEWSRWHGAGRGGMELVVWHGAGRGGNLSATIRTKPSIMATKQTFAIALSSRPPEMA